MHMHTRLHFPKHLCTRVHVFTFIYIHTKHTHLYFYRSAEGISIAQIKSGLKYDEDGWKVQDVMWYKSTKPNDQINGKWKQHKRACASGLDTVWCSTMIENIKLTQSMKISARDYRKYKHWKCEAMLSKSYHNASVDSADSD
jgi:hypothetical protein